MDEQAIVSMEEVTYVRDGFVLGPLNISIPKGYVTAVVGPNGSGKSTLFQMLLGLCNPSTGQITLDGQLLTNECKEQYKQEIGYLPELPWAHESYMRGKEKVSFYKSVFSNWNSTYYEQLREKLQIDDQLRLDKMSKGMRRKLDFIIALAHEPNLLLLDEPSSGLDPLAWKEMIEILHQYMEQEERSIVISSHIVEEVRRLADYILFVHQGKIVGFFEKDELFNKWCAYIIFDREISEQQLYGLPGVRKIEIERGGTYTIVTSEALAVEQWLQEQRLQSVTRTALDLDEILFYLIQPQKSQEV
ncbi:ABC transporter ATP-binding protein [Paenibacillus yanchengensis]|uniref:ABC transporter ATP-binding protein n=1 Tax=Paenibacillus yanchengensis TaxID=2035833 RepID=A0ABW4YJL3_9BACL